MEGNWRRHRAGEDDDGWRVASNSRGGEKWVRSSWRDAGGAERGDRVDRPEGVEGEEVRTGTRWEHRASHRSAHDLSHHPPARNLRTWEPNHHDNHDNLPEWATENPSESGGSFDASGAFHGGMYSDDDEDGIISAGGNRETRIRHMSEGNSLGNNSKPPSKSMPVQGQPSNRRATPASGTAIRERPKSLQPFEDKENLEGSDKRSVSPPKPVATPNNTPSKGSPPLVNSSVPRKVQSATNLDKVLAKSPVQNTQSSKSPGDMSAKEAAARSEKSSVVDNDKPQIHSELKKSKSTLGMMSSNNVRQKCEDDLDRMKEEADALVAKLMADEEIHKDQRSAVPPSVKSQVTNIPQNGQEKWFYRDPQGEVQGPFLASEMSEWFKAGYFNVNLLVRRACDERYSMLGDLIKMWGRVPFMPGPPVPPLKQVTEPVAIPVPVGMPGALPKAGMEDPLVLYQYQQMMMLQNQLVFRHVRSAVVAKLSQSEQWGSMSPAEQNQLIFQHMLQQPEITEISPIAVNPFVPTIAAQPANPIMQLFTQMQQAKTQNENHMPPPMHPTTPTHPGTIDPVQQLIQQMGGIQNLHGIQQPNMVPAPNATNEDNPIKSLLRQLNVNGHPNAAQIESVWPHPPPQIAPPQFGNPNWQSQMGPIPAMPPGQLPNSLWDIHTKEMKTEQQILEEQKLRLQEEMKKKEQVKKQEELERQQAEEESTKRKQQQHEEAEKARLADEAAKRTEEERKKKDEEKKRKEEEKRKQEEELKKKEEKKRKEEERKREEKRKQDEENNRKKQEEEKRKREEAKRLEEKQRKEEEKKKKIEEEQKREEEERIKKEEEARRKQAEAEEQAKRADQRRREAEALKRLQERNKAPWAQTPQVPPPSSQASLAEIQRLEREKKAEELRVQQLQQQLAQQRAAEITQEAAAAAEISKGLQLKWAEKAAPTAKPMVKSLAQIQQEEQERLAKVKQQERERQEKAAQKEPVVPLQSAGIWGTAAQSLNWTSATGANNQAWSNSSGTGGFWDDPAPPKAAAAPKQAAKQTATAKATVNPAPQHQNNKATKSKNKKEEESVKKLFEQSTAKPDDFTQWCNKTLSGLNVSVDIPTFVGFLRDIESAYEVKEYVRMYLGDNKHCSEFAKQFLEKRSKWRSAQRPHPQADDLCKPAPAVNPNATSTEFQEVKGKAKKPKKGKMFKVDSRILGFSVTAAPDRINVGDRDYGEGV